MFVHCSVFTESGGSGYNPDLVFYGCCVFTLFPRRGAPRRIILWKLSLVRKWTSYLHFSSYSPLRHHSTISVPFSLCIYTFFLFGACICICFSIFSSFCSEMGGNRQIPTVINLLRPATPSKINSKTIVFFNCT